MSAIPTVLTIAVILLTVVFFSVPGVWPRAVLLGQHVRSGFSVRDVNGGGITNERLVALAAAYEIGVKRYGYLQSEELAR
jgi:hypothetical protein